LFSAASTPQAMAALTVRQIERLIYPVGFYRNKARFVKATSEALATRFGGRVPSSLDELVTLPGVGRKTANLVLIVAFRNPNSICVDTHVHRIANRLGWVQTREPPETEDALYRVTARRWWPLINRYLVTWGQNVCRPIGPRCDSCALLSLCPRVGLPPLPVG
jgi:endonuclease III